MAKKRTVIIVSLTTFAILAGAKLASTRFRDPYENEGIIPLSEYIQLVEEKHGTEAKDGVDEAIDSFNDDLDKA